MKGLVSKTSDTFTTLGDYKKLVDFLIKKKKFGKMLFPNEDYASSLYKKLGGEFFANLGATDVKKKIAYK